MFRQLIQFLGITLILVVLFKPFTGLNSVVFTSVPKTIGDIDYPSIKTETVAKKEVEQEIPQQIDKQKTEVASITITKTPEDVSNLIDRYADEFHANPSIMKSIARCESGFRPEAVNGNFGGMFQFLPSTWSSNRKAMGLDPNPELRFNAEEAVKTAAFKMGRDGYGAWPACYKEALAQI